MKVIKPLLFFLLVVQLSAQHVVDFDSVESLLNRRQTEKAKSLLGKLISKNEKQPQAHYYLGVVHLMEGNYKPALEALEEAIDLDDTDYRFYERLGDAYGLKAQKSGILKIIWVIGDMRKAWEKAIELKPDLVSARKRLFSYYLVAPGIAGGDEEKAHKLAQEVSKLNPVSGHMLFARYYQKTENHEKAESELMQAVELDSLNGNLMNRIGYFYLNQDQPQKALRWMGKYVQLEPDNPNSWDSRGDCFMKLETYDSALVMYETALQKDKRFESSLYNRALVLDKLERKKDAQSAYKRYLELYPDGRYADSVKEKRAE